MSEIAILEDCKTVEEVAAFFAHHAHHSTPQSYRAFAMHKLRANNTSCGDKRLSHEQVAALDAQDLSDDNDLTGSFLKVFQHMTMPQIDYVGW